MISAARMRFDFAVPYARCMLNARPTFSAGACARAVEANNSNPDPTQKTRFNMCILLKTEVPLHLEHPGGRQPRPVLAPRFRGCRVSKRRS